MNAALILAGGISERLAHYDTPKQFIEVGGKMIISYCLETFEACPEIDLICVVADEQWRPRIGAYLFADAGISRQRSILNGLQLLDKHRPERVVIHDAVRPLVTVQDVSGLMQAAEGFDGVTPSLLVIETVYRSFDGKSIDSTLNRDELFIGQTPECYDFKKYLDAHKKHADSIDHFRGSSEIAVDAGMKIALTRGDPDNFKITTNVDLERFKIIVSGVTQ